MVEMSKIGVLEGMLVKMRMKKELKEEQKKSRVRRNFEKLLICQKQKTTLQRAKMSSIISYTPHYHTYQHL
jgi:hypothetical protein